MTTQKETKLFAFKLAEQKSQEAKPAQQWQVRDDVAVAGCTDPTGNFDLRYSSNRGTDDDIWC